MLDRPEFVKKQMIFLLRIGEKRFLLKMIIWLLLIKRAKLNIK